MKTEHSRPWLIVGGGLAAAEAATTLRKEGYEGRLIVVTDELRQPYERPALSKEYLRGEKTAEALVAGDVDVWAAPNTELLLGRRGMELDRRDRFIRLDDGTRLAFDRLLLATGSSPIASLPNASGPAVHTLRTIEDADRLRAASQAASSAVVVGGGWIGAEVAASLRQLGLEVSLVHTAPEVLEQRLGPVVGRRYTELHRAHAVRLVHGSRAAAVLDGNDGPGVELEDGRRVRGDLVVLGLGARPNVELASAAGLEIAAGGIRADALLETDAPGIFVAGDAAAPWHPRYRRPLRVEHWDTARRQGRVVAANFLGRGVTYDRLPYFYSDQFDLGMESWGIPSLEADVVVRELPETQGFVALWLEAGRPVAAMQANAWDHAKATRALVDTAPVIDVARFVDASVPLAEVTLAAAA